MNRPATVLPTTASSTHELAAVFNKVLGDVTALAEANGFPKAWCVPAAAVVRNVLDHIGVPGCRLIAVDCTVFAHQWAEPVPSTRGVRAGQVPMTHGSMGSDEIVGGLWGGHLVVYVPSAAGCGMPWLLDPTADQFDIPERDLGVTAYCTVVDKTFLGGEPLVVPTPTGRGVLQVRRNGMLRNQDMLLQRYEESVDRITDVLLSAVPAAA